MNWSNVHGVCDNQSKLASEEMPKEDGHTAKGEGGVNGEGEVEGQALTS